MLMKHTKSIACLVLRLAVPVALVGISTSQAARYAIVTTCPSVDVTYSTESGTEQQDGVTGGWSEEVNAEQLSLIAQANGDCNVQAIIYKSNGQSVSSSSSGRYVIASVHATDSEAQTAAQTQNSGVLYQSSSFQVSAEPRPKWALTGTTYLLGSSLVKSGLITPTANGYTVTACNQTAVISKTGAVSGNPAVSRMPYAQVDGGKLYVRATLFLRLGCQIGLGGLPKAAVISWGDSDKNIYTIESRYW